MILFAEPLIFFTYFNSNGMNKRERNMPTTIKHIKGTELPPSLQTKFNVKSHQLLTVTIEVEQEDTEEYDLDNLGDALIESLQEIVEAKKQGRELPNARDLINSL